MLFLSSFNAIPFIRISHWSIARYWFTGLNPSKDRPPGDIQKKSWTIPQIRCRILFVFQGHQSAAAYSRTHGGVGSYSTGARSGPETVGAVRGREAALTGEGRTPAQGE